jgi:hypothetical protein
MVTTPTDPSPPSQQDLSSPFGDGPFWDGLAGYWQRLQTFWQAHQKPLILGAAVLIALMYAYILVAALLAVLSTLWVVAGLFKLIGFGYSLWFVYHNLLWAQDRQAFQAQLAQLKTKVLGFANHIVESGES